MLRLEVDSDLVIAVGSSGGLATRLHLGSLRDDIDVSRIVKLLAETLGERRAGGRKRAGGIRLEKPLPLSKLENILERFLSELSG